MKLLVRFLSFLFTLAMLYSGFRVHAESDTPLRVLQRIERLLEHQEERVIKERKQQQEYDQCFNRCEKIPLKSNWKGETIYEGSERSKCNEECRDLPHNGDVC